MRLPENDIELGTPLPVSLAELAILKPIWMILLIFPPQELQGNPFSGQYPVDVGHVWQGPLY